MGPMKLGWQDYNRFPQFTNPEGQGALYYTQARGIMLGALTAPAEFGGIKWDL